jgi:hypothetical protein
MSTMLGLYSALTIPPPVYLPLSLPRPTLPSCVRLILPVGAGRTHEQHWEQGIERAPSGWASSISLLCGHIGQPAAVRSDVHNVESL